MNAEVAVETFWILTSGLKPKNLKDEVTEEIDSGSESFIVKIINLLK